MKKVLLAFDGTHFPQNAFDFARMLNENQTVILTGAFLPEPASTGPWSYAYGADPFPSLPLEDETVFEEIRRNVDKFKMLCEKNRIQYIIHQNFSDFLFPDLKKETRFADILLLSETFYSGVQPNDKYLKETIAEAECPVIVIPEEFDFLTSNILAYDGSASSVYAIKQFAYLFPLLALNETLLISMGKEGIDKLPDQLFIEELATRHFPDITLMREEINPERYFSLWLAQKKNALLVTGSFGRSALSRFFKKSFITDLFEDLKLPLFIAHRRK